MFLSNLAISMTWIRVWSEFKNWLDCIELEIKTMEKMVVGFIGFMMIKMLLIIPLHLLHNKLHIYSYSYSMSCDSIPSVHSIGYFISIHIYVLVAIWLRSNLIKSFELEVARNLPHHSNLYYVPVKGLANVFLFFWYWPYVQVLMEIIKATRQFSDMNNCYPESQSRLNVRKK